MSTSRWTARCWRRGPRTRASGPRTDDDGDGSDFHGERRSNDTHASTTDPDARLIRKGKGKEAKLSYLANTLMENRNGLLIGVDVRHATGTGERDGALELVDAHLKAGDTLGADKGYDIEDFVAALHRRGIRPHIARNTTNGRTSAIDGRSANGNGYEMSQQVRKRIEQGFGWVKTVGDLRKLPLRGLAKVKRLGALELRGLQPDPNRRHRRVVGPVADLREGASGDRKTGV